MRLRYKPRTSRDIPWLNYSALDAVWAIAAPVLAFFLREPSSFDSSSIMNTLFYVGVAGVFTIFALGWFRLSHSVAQFFSVVDALNIVKASIVAVLLTTLTCFLINRMENIPRTIPLLHFVLLAGGNAAGRTFRRARVSRRRRIKLQRATENIVVVGVSELALLYVQIIEELSAGTRQVVALLDDRKAMQGRFVRGYPVAGRIDEIEQVLDEYNFHGVRIDKLVLMCELTSLAEKDAAAISRAVALKQVSIEVLPRTLGLDRLSETRQDVIQIDTSITQPLPNRTYRATKRLFDFVVALVALIISAPIILVVMLLVMLDCGMPFLFWQVRIGRYGDRITVFKFRTLKAPYDSRGEYIPEEKRLSALGRTFRKIRVDELPQLFSVLVGEMSFIGPRPLLPEMMTERVGLRLSVRPGLTGWAQVNGATLLKIEEKVALDEWYVRHASWSLDLKIMMKTARMIAFGIERNEAEIHKALTDENVTSGQPHPVPKTPN